MSWKTENSAKRIFSTFKRLKNQIYTQDADALKHLINTAYINEKTYVNDNLLYAKLLCYVLNQNLHHYGDIKMAIKASSDILKEPLGFHLKILQKNLNDQDIFNYMKSIGVYLDSNQNNDDILIEHSDEYIEKLKTNWSFKTVSKSFYNTANEFLNDINNYI